MEGIAIINSTFSWAYGVGRKHLIENQRLAFISLAAAAAITAIAIVYRQLNKPGVLPFNHWSVSLGLRIQAGLPANETKEILITRLSPQEFVSRLYATMLRKPEQFKSTADAHKILPSSQQHPLSLEDKQAVAMQTWSMSLQPLFTLIKDNPLNWKELLQPIQSSPRLAYTILFNCMAPIAARTIWESLHNSLPASVQEIGNRYLEHKGKIALACMGLIFWLYYRMNQERGILTNLTENFASLHKAHRGLDTPQSYRKGIDQLLRSIGMSSPGQPNSNILWFYNKNTHSTFVGEIGNILAEITATGRIYNSKLQSEFPQLKNIQVVELNLKLFLTEYRNKDDVYRGWHDTLKHLKNSNILVVLSGIDDIKPYFLPHIPNPHNSEQHSDFPRSSQAETPCEKILSDLLILSLQQGKLRCVIELDVNDKTRMEADSKVFNLFSAIRAPDIQPDELKKLCIDLFAATDLSSPLDEKEIEKLFTHLKPVLDKKPLAPNDILRTIQKTQRTRAQSWRATLIDQEKIRNIEKAERNLIEVQKIKDQLLQKLWKHKRLQESEPASLVQALLLIHHEVIPLYKNAVAQLKNGHLTSPDLVTQMQKRFGRLFGPSTKREELALEALPTELNEKIKGQEKAIKIICDAIYKWRKIPPLDGKPLVLFFAGAPGIGKSESATQLAYQLNSTYDITETPAGRTHESNVRRINLNRKAPGGFIGWDKIKAEILCHLLYEPASVIILEEWDKMDKNDKSSLLELLDSTQIYLPEPWGFSSTNGPYVDKSCAMFILTSNIPIEGVKSAEDTIKKGITSCYEGNEKDAKAFLSRIDAVVPFENISTAKPSLIDGYLTDYIKQGVLPADRRAAVEKRLQKYDTTDARELQRIVQQAIFEELNPKFVIS